MACHGCAAKFGVFNKEKGCPKCGFSFCKKCLRFKMVSPETSSKEQLVCKNCYESFARLNKEDNMEDERPAGCLRRLESLENPARPPIVMYHHKSRMEKLKSGLEPEDREIAERLEKLKEERKRQQKEVPTEEDIIRRLAALKGQDPERAVEVATTKKQVFHLPDTRSDEQKTNDLIKQLLQEQILAAKHISPEDLIAQRLAKLRGDAAPVPVQAQNQSPEVNLEELAAGSTVLASEPTTDDIKELMKQAKAQLDAAQKELKKPPPVEGSEDPTDKASVNSVEEAAVEQVVQRALDEAGLSDDDDELGSKGSTDSQDNEELPWCTICNDDATVRCFTCDGDLYCNKCFTEFHADPDMKDHRRAPFVPQKKP